MLTFKVSLFLVLATAVTAQQQPQPTLLARGALPARGSAPPARGPPRAANPSLQHSSEELGRSNFYSYEDDDAKYDFSWDVSDEDTNTNIDFQEARQGDNTRGSYSVMLPDGRRQTVTYFVDGNSGYVAKVSYEGEARFSAESDELVRRV